MIFRKPSGIFAALLSASAVIFASAPANANVEEGFVFPNADDYRIVTMRWGEPAERGDPDALFNFAVAFELGLGGGQDLARAESYYEQAAAKGHLQAVDNYGLLLLQRGEIDKAMPLIRAAAGRGEPRAQFALGLAHFNGDSAPKDWARAYAWVSLAKQAGLPQAASALVQMDQHIPLEQRQKGVLLARELAQQAILPAALTIPLNGPATAGAD